MTKTDTLLRSFVHHIPFIKMHYNRYQPIDTILVTVHFIETGRKLASMAHERRLIS